MALFAAILDNHIFLGVVLSSAWIAIWTSIASSVSNLAKDLPKSSDSVSAVMIHAIDNVVGEKEQRFTKLFSKYLKESSSGLNGQEIFNQITQPESQLKNLVQAVYHTFDSLLKMDYDKALGIKVNLALIADNEVMSIKYHYPNNHPVTTPITVLNQPNSTIKNALKTRKLVIVENIEVELTRAKPKFVISQGAKVDEGSVLCYPIYYQPLQSVVFILSIHANKAGIFKQKFTKYYEQILKPYELRMKLEYSLLALKELTET